jgi:hypothetical protein
VKKHRNKSRKSGKRKKQAKHTPQGQSPAPAQNSAIATQQISSSGSPRLLPQSPTPTRRRSYIAGLSVGAITLAAAFDQFVGRPWPTEPAFSPGAPSFGSPFAVPFSITNKSGVSDLKNLSIKCGLASRIEGEPPRGGTLIQGRPGQPVFVTVLDGGGGGAGKLPAGETRSYTCAWTALRIDVGPNPKIVFAEMTFESEYESPWPWGGRKIVRSPTFFLDGNTVPPQWKAAPLR